jgi:Na+-driven multidrug efflux pump
MLTIIALNWNCTIGLDKYVPIFSQDTFNGLCKRFVSSIKSCILNIWSLWAFEFCLLMASYISEQAFAAQVVMLQIVILFLAMPYALGLVANHLITDSIDFYDAHEAKATSIIFQQYAIAIGILSVVTASLLRDKLLALYTNDDDLIVQCQSAWLPFMVFVFCWAVNLVISGALSSVSSSNQIINGYSQGAYWLVAAPMCLVGVLYLDETLETLWVCLALFALLITPVTFALLNSIDFITLTSERKKQDEQMNNIEMVRAALDEIIKT